jgi:hypothetical protein
MLDGCLYVQEFSSKKFSSIGCAVLKSSVLYSLLLDWSVGGLVHEWLDVCSNSKHFVQNIFTLILRMKIVKSWLNQVG